MITICDLPNRLPMGKVNGGGQKPDLFNDRVIRTAKNVIKLGVAHFITALLSTRNSSPHGGHKLRTTCTLMSIDDNNDPAPTPPINGIYLQVSILRIEMPENEMEMGKVSDLLKVML